MAEPKTGEIYWYNPDPRAILPLELFHCSHSLRRRLRRKNYHVTSDVAFDAVIDGCAQREETWISHEFKRLYTGLFSEGFAHSIEIWGEEGLVGGTYGVTLGGAFFAESMFHRRTDASKMALYYLIQHLRRCGFHLLEVQFLTPHLRTLGAIEISGAQYHLQLRQALQLTPRWEKILPQTP